ncbi:unnamed protein product [Rhizophagus irregularis]|uniref:Uncharacterized protein n=2 Tax=Rhizophagus irregularis TaxID=588596 RepID=A0A915Z7M0_9GLOM|nr:hypothetical protein RirG_176500 [Rhizophagus irregularis DAOM 197198w]GBC35824.1 hypothetical protein GLOIN_2v1775126 [Rhizophagus irregularis DAOM 181602=DAOM 197198]CAB4487727.1 unnamed protein product [Rhizophagus irregularis]CAB5366054.1 unnamed protein product [Rhizophagus irregularis]
MKTGILPSKDDESDEKDNDDEIVETVRPNSSADDLQDEEEIIPIIFLTEVLINVENLINLHNFPLENFK